MAEVNDRLVVGLDGSDAADVQAVTAWVYDPMLDDESVNRKAAEAREEHLRQLEEYVASACAGRPGVEVRCVAAEGDPADVLVECSRDALMLVVGSHGWGKWRGLLAGSVSGSCLRHAHCPVVVIPPRAWLPGSAVGRLAPSRHWRGSISMFQPGKSPRSSGTTGRGSPC
ncbi:MULTISPECIES: universal stress protein [unclassified Amycolatopsis]|nr:universal stress protein [Amycolatopsis sp. DSM 110486]